MYAEPQSDDHGREADMSPEGCSSSSPTCCEPQVTFRKKQDGQSNNDLVSLQKSVTPVYQAGQTGSSRGTTYECSNGTSQESSKASASALITSSCSRSENEIKMLKINKLLSEELDELKQSHDLLANRYETLAKDYVWAVKLSSRLVPVESSNEVLNDEPEKITSEHMVLQTTHKKLESSHEKVVESYVALDIAHEVAMTSVKLYQPPSHTCTCSHVEIILCCDKPCCSQATQSCVEHVVVKSCDDFIAQENDELKREVEKLQLELTKLKSKVQVQPSQDNCGIMVKKLKKGSNITTSAPQKGQVKKRKTQAKEECLIQLKGSNMGHNSYICPMEIKNKTKLIRGQKYISKTRTCFSCKKLGHMIATCPIQQSEAGFDQIDAKVNDETRRVKRRTCYTCREKGHFGKEKELKIMTTNQVLNKVIAHELRNGIKPRNPPSSSMHSALASKQAKMLKKIVIQESSSGEEEEDASKSSSSDEKEDTDPKLLKQVKIMNKSSKKLNMMRYMVFLKDGHHHQLMKFINYVLIHLLTLMYQVPLTQILSSGTIKVTIPPEALLGDLISKAEKCGIKAIMGQIWGGR
ncbi:hypothetical protein C2845_PM06G27510 [Panicum miliaceum]|uniref:CCHC-type domain-containing protein n=1 Tax=Panicum miliaceum TaxID=4540 RepID=A0A3L6R7J2_PANMI|nr:hypothetical protein C2845_PM06G27510 [Panicum miliaceum]